MKTIIKSMLAITLFFLSLKISYAANLMVPFYNVPLNPNESIAADYVFGQYSVIFCFSNDMQNIDIITWTYKGSAPSAVMPTTLVTNTAFEGQPADPIGKLSIRNVLSVVSIINCQYAF